MKKKIVIFTSAILLVIIVIPVAFIGWYSSGFSRFNSSKCEKYFPDDQAQNLFSKDQSRFEYLKKLDENILSFDISGVPSYEVYCPGKFTLKIVSKNSELNSKAIEILTDDWHGAQYFIEKVK